MIELAQQLVLGLSAKREIRSFLAAEERAVRFEYGISDVWLWYGGRVQDYDSTFLRVLSTLHLGSFRKFLVNRAKNGLSTSVLDLMGGDASFPRDLKFPANRQVSPSPLDAGLCVTLVDGRQERLRDLDRKLNIEVLCGDLTSKSTWKLIGERQSKMGIDVFDLIICRGAGGMSETMVPRVLYPFLFGKIWDRLTDKDGLFITQLPETVRPEELLRELRSISGTRLSFQPATNKSTELYPSLGIIKTRTAPKSLI